MDNKQCLFSASLMCADTLQLQYQIRSLIEFKIDFLHLDIMDMQFVPNLAMSFDMVNDLDRLDISRDIHLMVNNVEGALSRLKVQTDDIVTFHYEAVSDHHHIINMIKKMGCNAGIAINPETSPEVLYRILPSVQFITIMCVNPGFAGQKFIEKSYAKIETLRRYIDENKYQIKLSVDGNITHERIEYLMKKNIDMYVLGTSSLFNNSFNENLERIQNYKLIHNLDLHSNRSCRTFFKTISY